MPVRVLVVEDDAIVAAGLESTLMQLGHDVVDVCPDMPSCLDSVAARVPDLVLMDINLEGQMLGVQCALEVRRRHAISIIFVTAYADEETIEQAKEVQPEGYLIKPYRPAELRVTIEIAMHKRMLARRAVLHEERARVEAERFRALFEWAGLGIALLDRSGRVVRGNLTLQRMLGVADLGGLALEQLATDEFAQLERRRFEALMRREVGHYELEARYLRGNGELGWGAVTVTQLPASDGDLAIRFVSDISPRRLEQVVAFQESERRLLSVEVHDAISQPLAGIYLELQRIRLLHAEHPHLLEPALVRAESLVQGLLEDVCGLIEHLRTPLLDASSVLEAIVSLVDDVRRSSGLVVDLHLPARLPGVQRLVAFFLFRIIQESLANVQRHAVASRVEVQVELDGPWLVGRVSDDGLGAAVTPDPNRAHHGIRGMRERAELIGGWLTVSFPRGACVEFRLPLQQPALL